MITIDTIADQARTATGATIESTIGLNGHRVTLTINVAGVAEYNASFELDGNDVHCTQTRIIRGRAEHVDTETLTVDEDEYLLDLLAHWVRSTKTTSTL